MCEGPVETAGPFSSGAKMDETEVSELATNEDDLGIIIPEIELTIEETIYSNINNLEDESEDIVNIDYNMIVQTHTEISGINTVKKLTMIPDLENKIITVIDMLDEEQKSMKASSDFIAIAGTLFSNTEIDFYEIFEGDIC